MPTRPFSPPAAMLAASASPPAGPGDASDLAALGALARDGFAERSTAPDTVRRLARRRLIERSGSARGAAWRLTEAGRAVLAAAADEGAAGRAAALRHVSIDDAEGHGRRVLRNEAESPLAWLRRRKAADGRPMLDDASFVAGERFRADLTRAAMVPRTTANWDASAAAGGGGRGPAEATDAALAAQQRIALASKAVGADLAGLLIDVCGFLKGLEQVERERGWPARSAKVVLLIALARLAEHYGYAAVATGPDRSRGIRTWSAPPA
ncbi:MAG: DUF6456 domain-containing protein [Alsobacter sp.]